MEQKSKISPLQILTLLFSCRFFLVLVASGSDRYSQKGLLALLVPLLGGALALLFSLPLFWLCKRFPGQSLGDICRQAAPKGEKALLLWQLALCLLLALLTASQSERFVTSNLYPQAKGLWVLLYFIIVVSYGAALGLEALSRMSLLSCGLVAFSFGLIGLSVARQLDPLFLGLPQWEEAKNFGSIVLAYAGQHLELVLLLQLQPHSSRPSFKRDWLVYVLGGAALTAVVSLLTLGVLGPFATVRNFPVYALASLSGHSVFSRLDYLHIFSWTFSCLLRCGIYSWAALELLGQLLPKAKPWLLRTGLFAFLLGGGLLLSQQQILRQYLYLFLTSGLPLLLTGAILPLLLLWRSRKPKEKEKSKEVRS